MMGIYYQFERPLEMFAGAAATAVPAGKLRVPDRVRVAGFERDQPGEALSAALDEVEPRVLAEGWVGVRLGCGGEKLGERSEILWADVALHLDVGHATTLLAVPGQTLSGQS
jgi:hypothetical protein